MEEKEDPDDVIMTETGYITTTPKSEFLSLKENYKKSFLKSIEELDQYLDTITEYDKKAKDMIELHVSKISTFVKLFYIAENYQEYEEYLYKVYRTMCDAYNAEQIKSYKRIDKSLDKVLKEGRN